MLVTLFGMTVFIHPVINVFDAVSMMALQLFRESKTGFFGETVMDFRLVQSLKTDTSMLVTDLGMLMEVSPMQPSKALFPMFVTLSGILMDVSLEQP